MSITRGILGTLVTSAIALGAVSCGGTSSNNDQGTSFLAFGYFADTTGETGSAGQLVILAPDSATVVATSNGVQFLADGNNVLTTIGLQNRLASQFIRVQRIDCSYNIPGADAGFSIPDDSFNSATIIGASPTADDRDDETGVAVPLGTEDGSRGFVEFEVASPDILAYVNVNRNRLPELPFRMNVSCRAVGVTQSGDTLTSNELVYFIRFFDQAECCTGSDFETAGDNVVTDGSIADDGGFQSGPGAGGDLTFDDGTNGSTVGTSTVTPAESGLVGESATGSTAAAGTTTGSAL